MSRAELLSIAGLVAVQAYVHVSTGLWFLELIYVMLYRLGFYPLF